MAERKKQKPKHKEINKKLIGILWFLVKFNLLAIPLYLIIYMNLTLPAVQSFVANSVHTILSALGYMSELNGYMINFPIVSVEITFDCTGWKSVYALFALVVATPSVLWKKKLKFLAVGLPAIFVINILRIVTTLAVVMSFGIEYLEVAHNILWQEGLILAVLGIWYFWLRKVGVVKT
jgi:exosortase/archaeosortase family protein